MSRDKLPLRWAEPERPLVAMDVDAKKETTPDQSPTLYLNREREIPGGLQGMADLNGGGRPDSLIIGLGLAPERSLTNDGTPRNLPLSSLRMRCSANSSALTWFVLPRLLICRTSDYPGRTECSNRQLARRTGLKKELFVTLKKEAYRCAVCERGR